MWMLPLYLHFNKKSDYDDDDLSVCMSVHQDLISSLFDGFYSNFVYHCMYNQGK